MSDLTGSNGATIPNSLVRWKAGSLDLLGGEVNANVQLDSVMNTYHTADGSSLFINRDPAPNMRKKSKYGSKLDMEITIPPYMPIDTYNGVITYTLYEN